MTTYATPLSTRAKIYFQLRFAHLEHPELATPMTTQRKLPYNGQSVRCAKPTHRVSPKTIE